MELVKGCPPGEVDALAAVPPSAAALSLVADVLSAAATSAPVSAAPAAEPAAAGPAPPVPAHPPKIATTTGTFVSVSSGCPFSTSQSVPLSFPASPSAPPSASSLYSSSSFTASSSSSSPSDRLLSPAFSAWSAAATALPDPLCLPSLLPVPGTAVPATATSKITHTLAFPNTDDFFLSPAPSSTVAPVSAAFFGTPEVPPAVSVAAAAPPGASASANPSFPSCFAFASAAAAAAAPFPSSSACDGSPWYPLRSPALSPAAAAAAASKRHCVRLQPGSPSLNATGAAGVYTEATTADCVEVTALGAGSEVGRSCVLLQHRGYCVMFDCGVHPAHTGIGALPIFDAFDMRKVAVCLITHFHLDHCGALPYLLCKSSFRGRIFMTAPTKVIARLLWLDYARMAAFEEERSGAAGGGGGAAAGRGGGGGAGGGGGSAAIYTEEDVDTALNMIETIDFHQEVEVQGIKISCYGAGHVLGACMFLVETGGVRTLYTGDFSSEEDRHVPAAELPAVDVQLLLCESTYGVQVHEARQQREDRLIAAILEIVLQRRGKVLLPVFALGRVQELLLILEEYWRSHPGVQHVPILFISPLASKSLAVFDAFLHMAGHSLRQQALQGENPFFFQFVKSLKSYDGAAARLYVHRDAPAVIFAAPGMLQSGASRRIFEVLAPHAKNGVILTGYSVKGTLAEELKREPDYLVIQRNDFHAAGGGAAGGGGGGGGGGAAADGGGVQQQQVLRRRCSCQVISFSAHSDYLQTSAFIKQLRVPNVVLVHGERNEMRRLRDKLQEETPDLAVFTPEILQTVSLQFCSDSGGSSSGSGSSDSSTSSSDSSTSSSGCHGLPPAPVCAVAAGKLADNIYRESCSRSWKEEKGNSKVRKGKISGIYSGSSSSRSSSRKEEEEDVEADSEWDDDLLVDVEGVLVLEEGEHPLLVHADELSAAARIPVMRLQQKLRLAFPYPLCILRKAAALVFEDVVSFAAAAAASSSLPAASVSCLPSSASKTARASPGETAAAEELHAVEERSRSPREDAVSGSLCRSGDSGSSIVKSCGSRDNSAAEGSAVVAGLSYSSSLVLKSKESGSCKSREKNTGDTTSSSIVAADVWGTAGDAAVSDAGFCVADCVSVYRHPTCAEEVLIEWLASPTADIVADGLSFLLLDVLRTKSSSARGCTQLRQLLCDREEQTDAVLVDVLQAQLSHLFGAVQVLPRGIRTPHAEVAGAATTLLRKEGVCGPAGKAADTRKNGDRAAGAREAAAGAEVDAASAFSATPQQRKQQQQEGGQQNKKQQRQVRDGEEVGREELDEGEVVLRFWTRRLTAVGSGRAGGSSSRSSSAEDQHQQRDEEREQAAAAAAKRLPAKTKQAFVLVPVEIDMAMRTVHCEDAEVRQRVQAFVRRVEASLLPLPVVS